MWLVRCFFLMIHPSIYICIHKCMYVCIHIYVYKLRSIIVILVGNRVSNEAVCVLLHGNALRENMNLPLLLPAMSKTVWRTGFLSLSKATSLSKGILNSYQLYSASPPLYPHFNWPSGFWPCVKSCLVGGSDK